MDAPEARIGSFSDRTSCASALAAFVAACGLLALHFGQGASWDLRNYHLYDPYAWLTGRAAIDLAPAGLQTFFNPLLHVPAYVGTRWLSPAWLTFVLGCVHGLNVLPLYLLARRLLPDSIARGRPWWPLAVAIVGATGATQLGELGATQGDNLLSLPLLAAAALLFAAPGGIAPLRRVAGAGLLAGAAVGLKLTTGPIAAGLGLGALLVATSSSDRLRYGALFAGAALLGLVAFGGFWMWELYQRYGDPLYPMLGAHSPSPWAVPFATHDARWFPRTPWHVLGYPWAWTLDWGLVSDLKFRDLRLPLLYAAGLLLPWWRRRPSDPVEPRRCALLAAMLVGYAVWLGMFGYYRYLAALEMLAPLAFVLVLYRALPGWRGLRPAAAVALVLMFIGTNPSNWDRVTPGEHFVEVRLPLVPPPRATVVLAGQAPLAYLALAFPPEIGFVRVESSFYGGRSAPQPFDRLVAERLDAAPGPLLALAEDRDRPALDDAMRRFGLRIDYATCGRVESNLAVAHEAPIMLCAATRRR